ncbi:MAG: hypothetical protein OXE99_04210, partial [Cellvibrionales bacterium]|nr:hypothetical protein [Cellvibrionales bacterium]
MNTMIKDYRVQVALVITTCIVLYLGYQVYSRNFESTNNATLQCDIVDITSQVNGVIEKISFIDDQHTELGDSLVRIEKNDYASELQRNEALFKAAKIDHQNEKVQLDILK